ncbi:hypothetical protein QE152_g39789 [Popillia japonica]|uniref:Uncharacterized protein n=1 Tax=Popillia japonica TaxID=7064 RepID=A0AAW1HTQ2_POPJA
MAQISGHGNQTITSGYGYDDTAQLMTQELEEVVNGKKIHVMGNRKKNKYTKRVLKSIKVQRLTEYHRKKKEELEDYGQFPAEDAGESNFDAGFDTLPEVLDIKVEEPEVTCQFEE